MHVLSFRISSSDFLAFDLLVDGQFLGDLIPPEDGGLPYWLFELGSFDLPRPGPNSSSDFRIITVCCCGEYGCGHVQCCITDDGQTVTFRDFQFCNREDAGKIFTFASSNYREVVASITKLAHEEQVRESARSPDKFRASRE